MTNKRSPITTHVLDLNLGKPGVGIPVRLEFESALKVYENLASKKTNSDGRIEDFLAADQEIKKGKYRLVFDTKTYFGNQSKPTFFPEVTLTFEITDPKSHHHVPLLLNSHGFSTYRGT